MTEQKFRQTRVKMGPDASHRWEQRFSIPENDGRKYDRVQYLLHQGFYAQAMPILDSLADRFPEHPYIQNLLGVAFVQRDKNEAALGRFERALELSPPDCRALRADVLANMGGTRVKLGQLESAERDYFRALEYDSNSGGTFANLGNIRLRQQRYHEAIEFFYTAFELGLQHRPLPNYVTGSVLGMGRCFRIIGEESAASMMLEIVRKLPPEHMYLIRDTLDSDEREVIFYNRDLERRT